MNHEKTQLLCLGLINCLLSLRHELMALGVVQHTDVSLPSVIPLSYPCNPGIN